MKEYNFENFCLVKSSKRIFANQYTNAGIPFYRGKEITLLSMGQSIYDLLYISEQAFQQVKTNGMPENNDILITAVGTIGSIWLVDTNKPFYFKDGNIIWLSKINQNIVLPKYLKYAMISSRFQKKIEEVAIGSNQKALTIDSVKKLQISFPKIETQQHIVDILGSIDNYIENNNKKIENLINFGQLKYQEDISSNDYEYIALSKLVKISRGASPRPIQNYLTTTGHSWVKISDVTSLSAPFLFETKEYITDEGTNHSVAVYPNDLILSNSATPGIPVFMETNAFVHDGWLIIRDFKRITPNYLFWVLKNDRNIILSQGNGSIFTNLKTDILKSHEIPVPSKEKMEKLDNLYSTILLKIKHLTKENLKLNELKQLYLKKFFG